MERFYNPYSNFSNKKMYKANFHIHCRTYPKDAPMYENNDLMESIAGFYKNADYDIVMHAGQDGWYDNTAIKEKQNITVYNGQEHIFEGDGVLLVGTDKFCDGSIEEGIDCSIRCGGFSILCHPNQNEKLPTRMPKLRKEQYYEAKKAIGLEIFTGFLGRKERNGIPCGISVATDFWDEMLSSGRVIWGFGGDDSHAEAELNNGWTEIYADSDSLKDITRAVKEGALTVSRGSRLKEFSVEDDTLYVRAGYMYLDCDKTEYIAFKENGTEIARTVGPFLKLKLNDEKYVRVEAITPDGSKLWLQPVLNKDYYDVSV